MGKTAYNPRLLITITDVSDEKKVNDAFRSLNLHVRYQLHGFGTAPSMILDIFGASKSRHLTCGLLLKHQVSAAFKILDDKLHLTKKGHGIAFTISINAMQTRIFNLMSKDEHIQNKGDEKSMNENPGFCAIVVSVNPGFSDDVVEVAQTAGAGGGTIMKGMREESNAVATQFSIPLKDEQDFVMILVRKDKKHEIMSAIREKCGMKTDAKGVVFSIPIDEVFGLE